MYESQNPRSERNGGTLGTLYSTTDPELALSQEGKTLMEERTETPRPNSPATPEANLDTLRNLLIDHISRLGGQAPAPPEAPATLEQATPEASLLSQTETPAVETAPPPPPQLDPKPTWTAASLLGLPENPAEPASASIGVKPMASPAPTPEFPPMPPLPQPTIQAAAPPPITLSVAEPTEEISEERAEETPPPMSVVTPTIQATASSAPEPQPSAPTTPPLVAAMAPAPPIAETAPPILPTPVPTVAVAPSAVAEAPPVATTPAPAPPVSAPAPPVVATLETPNVTSAPTGRIALPIRIETAIKGQQWFSICATGLEANARIPEVRMELKGSNSPAAQMRTVASSELKSYDSPVVLLESVEAEGDEGALMRAEIGYSEGQPDIVFETNLGSSEGVNVRTLDHNADVWVSWEMRKSRGQGSALRARIGRLEDRVDVIVELTRALETTSESGVRVWRKQLALFVAP